MVKSSTFAATAALLSLAAGLPAKRSPATVIKQVATGRSGLSGPAAYLKALQKYHADEKQIAPVRDATGSVTATPQDNDSEYLCPVTIGSQTFQLDFDTGSSDLWVLGPNAGAGSGHTIYNPGSSASEEQGETWSITYGDGSSASGVVYSDSVTIGGLTVTGQAVEQATTASSAFTSGPNDGLVGLAWNSLNTVTPNQAQTFFSNAIAQGTTGVLTADLRKGEAGSYTFGDIPSDLYSGSIAYTPVDNSQGFWSFTADSYSAGTSSGGSLTGIADTGTTLMLLSDDIVSAYWGQVSSASSGSSGYSFNCGDTLPDFTLSVAGYNAVVPGDYINYAPNGDGTCFGGIQSAGSIGFNIFGDIFLKSQLVVFDQSNTQLGLAAKSGN